ncbi:MAG TPA: CoA-binding protein [Candidatus Omnitrophota bacterium]|nr:CoA-binding protein [Candidatus Omnitrophota bacterium]
MNQECEFPKANATTDEIKAILKNYKRVAVVGLSDKQDRPSYHVAEYLQNHGYTVIPVNPMIQEWKGIKSYSDLRSIPGGVEIVDIFRKPTDVPKIVDEAIYVGAKVIWMQEGIVHNESADRARAAGLKVVMNKCMLKEHRLLA